MANCTFCGGDSYYPDPANVAQANRKCPHCKGTGVEPVTKKPLTPFKAPQPAVPAVPPVPSTR